MDIIWTKDELKQIKKILLNQTDLKLDEDNMTLVKRNGCSSSALRYASLSKEIETLFYTQDTLEIQNVLLKASQVKSDINNPLHLGLITTLANVDINDYTQIFEIFKQLISQYERIINNVITKLFKPISSLHGIEEQIDFIKKKIQDIKDNIETEEEIEIKRIMKETFSYSNGVEKSYLFSSITTMYNNNLKDKMINILNIKLKNLIEYQEKIKDSACRDHFRKISNRKLKIERCSKGINPFIR